MELFIAFTVLQLFAAGFFLFLCLAFLTGGPFVPSSKKSVRAMTEIARIKQGQYVLDLGSGDGRMLFAASGKGAFAHGIEINPYLVWFTRLKARLFHPTDHVTVQWANIWKTTLPHADIIFVYLIPWKMEHLAYKLEREMKPGTLIVSNSFMFPNWKLIRKDPVNHVYAYQL